MAFNNYLEDENDKPYFTTNSLAYYYDKMEGFAKAVDGSAKALNLTKEEVEKRLTLYIEQNKNELDQRLAQWDGKLETFDSSVETLLSEWVVDGTLTPLIDSTLIDQKVEPLAAQLAETEVEAKRKKEPEDLSDRTLALVTGNGTINVLSVPQDGSVTLAKTDSVIQSAVGQIHTGKKLFESMLTDPITNGTTTNSNGWAMRVTYNGETITAVRIYIPLVTFTGQVKASIRLGTNVNTAIAEASPLQTTHAGYYTFLFDQPLTPSIITENSFYVAVESVGRVDRILNSGLSTSNVSSRVILADLYQLTTSGSWYELSTNAQYAMDVEFLGAVDLKGKVDNDLEYQSLKAIASNSQTANELFSVRNDELSIGTYIGSMYGWAIPLTYQGELITSARIHLNMDSFNGSVISTIRKPDLTVLATSSPVKPTKKGYYNFVYDKGVDVGVLTGTDFILTIESVGRVDKILQASDNNVTGANRLTAGADYKYLNGSGNWVSASTNNKYALFATLYNNNVSEALSKKAGRAAVQAIDLVKMPKRFYTVYNDANIESLTERHYALPIYTEYLTNQHHDILFENNSDKFPLLETPISANVETKTKEVGFKSNRFVAPKAIVNQLLTKASVPNKKSFVLTIGDSVTDGANSSERQYWKQAAELFEKESIDFNRPNDVLFIGRQQKRQESPIDYKGVSKILYSGAEGRSGWNGLDFLRYSTVRRPNQETWDALGLGNGTGTDYTGSEAQKTLIRNTPEVNTSLTPQNPFFDNNKTGTNRFSMAKYLSRYRTLDDNGNRLTLGNGTGSLITAENIGQFDVCTPTHVVIALGHNDFAYHSADLFYLYAQELVAEIKKDLPNVIVVLSIAMPRIGLWTKERYPNFIGTSTPTNLDFYHKNISNWANHFTSYNEETNKLFMLPTFFVTPSAEAYKTIEHKDGSGNVFHSVNGDDLHPGYRAHANWGYQLYALLKYTMTL